jgi:hypothetical protein
MRLEVNERVCRASVKRYGAHGKVVELYIA